MKVIIVFSAVVAVALAQVYVGGPVQPQPAPSKDAQAQVLRSEFDNIGVDGYQYAYETSNGISGQESAVLQNAGSENEALAVRGSYSYTGADGQQYTVNYVADDNGFQPEGAHLPKA